MKKKFYLLMAMVLLVGLLPAAALAAQPKPPFVTVRVWTLPVDPNAPIAAQLSAWDINWRVPRAATIDLGYVHCEDDVCKTVVEATYRVMKEDRYPQNLDLAGKVYHHFGPGDCTLEQFVNVEDRSGALVATSSTFQDGVCIDP